MGYFMNPVYRGVKSRWTSLGSLVVATGRMQQPLTTLFMRRIASMPPADIYRRQLNGHNYEIRLLELYTSLDLTSKLPFKCRLKHDSLKKPQPYVAVSYFWGDLQNKHELVVDDVTVQVSRNLLTALQQMWRMAQTSIWVDFLCINQSDNEEKSGQVRMMDTIFAKAATVYAWLGTESHDSDMAMAVLGASKRSQQVELPEEVEVAADAVIRLFSRPYWTRCWVIQEICRARNPAIVCGRRYVHWGTMMNRLDALGMSIPAQYARHLIAPLRHMRYRDQNRFRADTETGLIPLIVSSRRSLASDPRDELYALLSLAKDGRVLVPTPNYSQTAKQIFVDTARCMIEEHYRTDIILLAHRSRGERKMPSWVPDWANLKCTPPPWVMECLDQGRPRLLTPNEVSDGNTILKVQGYEYGRIVDSLDMESYENKEQDHGDAIEDPMEPAVSQDIVTCLVHMTIGSEADIDHETIVRILRRIHRQTEESPRPKSSRLESWVFHNANRKIGSATFIKHLHNFCTHDASSISPPESSEDSHILDQKQREIEESFDRLDRLRMMFAITEDAKLRIVNRDARAGDVLYVLQNCPLPVILRPVGGERRFTYVGEVFAPKEVQESLGVNDGRMNSVWIE
ncbi:HET-domain-containing protein [Xylariaceae sp. FL1272]|nr:HET-domain-containing protein [Xylariaceae sp. FL1272]